MTDDPIRVLFVSTSNAARSIMAEAILRGARGAGFSAQSAGTEQIGERVHQFVVVAGRAARGTTPTMAE